MARDLEEYSHEELVEKVRELSKLNGQNNRDKKRLFELVENGKADKVIRVHVTGPTGCGKSAILAKVEKALTEAFGCHVISPELDSERRMGDPDDPKEWERPGKEDVVFLSEGMTPKPSS